MNPAKSAEGGDDDDSDGVAMMTNIACITDTI